MNQCSNQNQDYLKECLVEVSGLLATRKLKLLYNVQALIMLYLISAIRNIFEIFFHKSAVIRSLSRDTPYFILSTTSFVFRCITVLTTLIFV